MKYNETDKEKIIPIAENLEIMIKTKGWKWLENEIQEEMKKELDNFVENDIINSDVIRGKIQFGKFIFKHIERYLKLYQKVMEGENA